MLVRERHDADIAACVQALSAVHATNHYPTRWPDDPGGWLSPSHLLAAWVAEDEDTRAIVGHIAMCGVEGASDAQPWLAASRLPAERLSEVARLFVTPDAQDHGVGARLLDVATRAALRRQLRPVLKVLDADRRAIALYERFHWQRVVSIRQAWSVPDESQALLHYYLGPT
jgi:GNAT superfamily N-acetyltransferase